MSFIKLGLAAYTADIENFKLNYDKEFLDYQYIIGCICRGCAYSLDFSKYILTLDYLSNHNYKVAVSCLIMHDIIDPDLIEKYKPFCIWYPFVPKKSTCYGLPESMKYSVAILSILMNWKDVYNSLDLENDFYIGHLIKRFGRDFDFDYSNTKYLVDLRNESISPSEREHWNTDILLSEEYSKNVSILDMCNISNPFVSFQYYYPLGLKSVSSWNIEKYIINKDVVFYHFYDDQGFKEKDYDKCPAVIRDFYL